MKARRSRPCRPARSLRPPHSRNTNTPPARSSAPSPSRPPARRPGADFNRGVALLHSFEFGRRSTRSTVLARRPVVRDGVLGHRAEPLGQSVRRASSPGRCSSGARGRRKRAGDRRADAARARLHRGSRPAVRERGDGPAPRRVLAYEQAMEARQREIRTTPRRRSSTRSRSIRRRCRPTRPTRSSCKAAGILEPLFAAACRIIPGSRTTSSTPTTRRRSRPRRSTAARRYAALAPAARTRCTCRRTPSRASAPGRSRSTPTSRPAEARAGRRQRGRAARARLPDLRVPADGAGHDGARVLDRVERRARSSIRRRAAARRRRWPGSCASPRSRRAMRSSAARGPKPRR